MAWKTDSEQSYLSFDERIVISARLHPVTAVLPGLKVLVIAVLAWVALTGSIDPVLLVVLGVVVVQWVRIEGYAGSLGFVPVALIVGLLAAGLYFSVDTATRFVVVFGSVLLVTISGIVEYITTRLYLTDKRIMLRSGILTERRSTLPLRALTDMRYDQTIPGRLLDYGHFFVESAGQNQALSQLRYVDDPVRFYRIAMQLALGGTLPPEEMGRE